MDPLISESRRELHLRPRGSRARLRGVRVQTPQNQEDDRHRVARPLAGADAVAVPVPVPAGARVGAVPGEPRARGLDHDR